MEFRDVKIGEFANVLSGYAFKSSEFTEDGIPIIKIKNIRVGSIDLDDVQFVDESYLDLEQKFHVRKGDLLISLTGSHLTQPNSVVGRVARYSGPHALLNQRAGKIIFEDENICDRKFLYYLLSTLEYKRKLALFASGAASQANISPSQVESLEVKLPDYDFQQRIASILSAFDDLIENNSRRIEILEEMARRIYREWFVHFWYPGHEDDPSTSSGQRLVDSGTELGEIPEGWEVKNVIDLYDTSAGGTPSRKKDEYFDGSIPWVKTKELNDSFIQDTEETISKLGLNNSSAKLFPKNSVLVAMYGATVGQLGILDMDATTNQACCAVMEKVAPFDYSFIFFSLLEYRNKLIGLKQGAAQQNINQGIIKEFKILKPPADILKEFQDKLYPLLDQIRVIKKKNNRLKETRDLLLPKLISGGYKTHE